jgi:hypothetical protein
MDQVHALLAAAFRSLDGSGARWCLLRGRDRILRPDGDVDLLFDPADAGRVRRALEETGFVMLRRWAGGTQHFFLGHDRATDHWIYLHAVTSLDFGAMHALRAPDAAAGVLERLGTDAGVPMPAPDDHFWITLLHALLDKGATSPKHRDALARRAGDATADGAWGRLVDRCGAPGVRAAGLVDAARSARWDDVDAAAAPLAAAWERNDASTAMRRRFHQASLTLAKLREIVTRRGVATAIVAPDGAGKSTVIASLEPALFFRVKTYYLGLEGGIFANRPPSRIPGGGLLQRAMHAWSVYARSRADLSRRRFVLFDRYPYEALLPSDRPLGFASRLRRAVMGRLLPPPHLVVFLDAPGEVLHARKQEHSVERLERDRQGYLSLAKRRGWTVIDATQGADEVRRDVTEAIWQVYRRRYAGS